METCAGVWRPGWLAACLCGLALMVMGDENPPPTPGAAVAPPGFKVLTSPQPVRDRETVLRGVVLTETNRYSFVLPPGTRLQSDVDTKKITVVAADSGCALTMQVVNAPSTNAALPELEVLRGQVPGRFTDGKIVNETSMNPGSDSGPAFDVAWHLALDSMTTRVGFVPVPGGWLEFNFTAKSGKFQAQLARLNQFMLSFRRSGPEGELKVQKILPPE
jgi:hypothetical protein